jgi:hypothetical protein
MSGLITVKYKRELHALVFLLVHGLSVLIR